MKTNELPFGLDRYLDKFMAQKPAKKPLSAGKIIGIGIAAAAAVVLTPYDIKINKEKKEFSVKSLALHISGGRDENGELEVDVNIPWIKKSCRDCSEMYDFSNCGDFGDLEDFEAPDAGDDGDKADTEE